MIAGMTRGRRHEVEIKLPVGERARLDRLLGQLGAVRLGRVHEMNVLFDTPRGQLRKRGRLLRLRVVRHARGGRGAFLTYKGPSRGASPLKRRGAGGRYKVREEIEMPVVAPERLPAILRAIGLVPAFRYEKFRTTYRLPGVAGVVVELDETPIGTFLELEGVPRGIDRAARLLGYAREDYIALSYLGLYRRVRGRRGPAREMIFGGPAGRFRKRNGERARRGSFLDKGKFSQ